MKKIWGIILIGAIAASVATAAEKREKKNAPKKSAVEDTLKALGEDHFPERMKVRSLGSIKTESTYYHIFVGALKGGYSYRSIVYDNKETYLGYYECEYEPTDYEDGGAILFRINASDPERIRVEDKGPIDNTRIDGLRVKFIKAPEAKKTKSVMTDENTDGLTAPEFRQWTITLKGKKHSVRAIYVSQNFGTVTIRAEASGKEKSFPKSSISEADKAYIVQFSEN